MEPRANTLSFCPLKDIGGDVVGNLTTSYSAGAAEHNGDVEIWAETHS